jgi:hypothetical protein
VGVVAAHGRAAPDGGDAVTGAAYGLGFCALCDRIFNFNPMRVPIVFALGERRPICRECMADANANRARRCLPLLDVPDDAYEPEIERTGWWIDRWRKSTAFTDMTLSNRAYRNLLDECALRGPIPDDDRFGKPA